MTKHTITDNLPLSQRLQKFKASPTMAVAAKAAALREEGRDIISLSLGEPDFDTADFIKQAAIVAMEKGQTKYTAVGGTPALKRAIIKKLARDNHLNYEPNQILTSTGAKQSISNALYAMLDPGDEVIIPAPYWVSYPDMVLLAEGKPVIIQTAIEQGLKLLPEQLSQAITPKTKAIILNSPSNPSGVMYTKAELAAIADVLLKHPNIWVISDDIYEMIRWKNSEPFSNIVNACPSLIDRTVVVNGVSKAYAMTGWRIGYAAAPAYIIAGMTKLQSQSTSCPNTIAQAAAEAALLSDQHCVATMVGEFEKRYQLVQKQLQALPGFTVVPTQGAFYCFPDASEAIKKLGLSDDIAFADYLLEEAGVAIVPGSAFGCPGFIRLSFATSEALLMDALGRIKRALR